MSFYSFASGNFEVVPLNSPVKGDVSKFQMNVPADLKFDQVKIKVLNANDLTAGQKPFEVIKPVNNQLHVGISKLPPGFYRLYVKLVDQKSKKEFDFMTKYHDFVRFVIEERMPVPMPDPKINASTIRGVDSDNDGIRDDIQKIINESFASKLNTKLAAKQLAIASQNDLLQSVDVESARVHMDKYSEALHCLDWVNPNTRGFSQKLISLM